MVYTYKVKEKRNDIYMCQTRGFDEKKMLDRLIKDCSEILDSGIIGAPAYKTLQRPSVVCFGALVMKRLLRFLLELENCGPTMMRISYAGM